MLVHSALGVGSCDCSYPRVHWWTSVPLGHWGSEGSIYSPRNEVGRITESQQCKTRWSPCFPKSQFKEHVSQGLLLLQSHCHKFPKPCRSVTSCGQYDNLLGTKKIQSSIREKMRGPSTKIPMKNIVYTLVSCSSLNGRRYFFKSHYCFLK